MIKKMSHITPINTDIQFTDTAALIEALKATGTFLQGVRALSVVIKDTIEGTKPTIGFNLTFVENGKVWQPRADQWGGLTKQYETIVEKIGQKYVEALATSFTNKYHLTTVSKTTDEAGNIQIKARAY